MTDLNDNSIDKFNLKSKNIELNADNENAEDIKKLSSLMNLMMCPKKSKMSNNYEFPRPIEDLLPSRETIKRRSIKYSTEIHNKDNSSY